MRKLLALAALLLAPIAQPAFAQDTISASTAPGPTQVRLPLVRAVQDGDRVVLQIVGSVLTAQGTSDGLYIGENGLTSSIGAAQDIRGPMGQVAEAGQPIEGPAGPMGAPGKSAYQLWLERGNDGTVADFLASLRGAQGAPGIDGGPGPAGPAGANGTNGQDGAPAEMRISSGYLQWRAGSGSWSNLASIEELRGPQGVAGPQGPQGVGIQGPAGPAGAQGVPGSAASISIGAVTTGAPGSQASVQNVGTSSAAVLNFSIPAGATGATGAQGPAAATSVVFLNNATLTQTAIVAIALGPRTLSISTNCVLGDRLIMVPSAAMPAGYMLGDIFCSANGTAQATLYAPLLAIGASYSITVRIIAFR